MKRPRRIPCNFCGADIAKRFLQEHFLTCAKAPILQPGEHICSLCFAVKNFETDFPMSIQNPCGKSHGCKLCTQHIHNHWRRLKNDIKQAAPIAIEGRPLRTDGKPSRVWKQRPCPICGTKYNFRAMHAHVQVCDGTPNQPRRPDSPYVPDTEKVLNDELVKNKKVELRARQLWNNYGITLACYDRMFAEQGGRCAICQGPPLPSRNNAGKVFCVDHDHNATGPHKVRGLLCRNCNHGLGQFGDNEDAIIAASAYILKYRAIHALHNSHVENPANPFN